MEFIIEVIRDDPSLEAVKETGEIFRREAKLRLVRPLAIETVLDWWEVNKKKF